MISSSFGVSTPIVIQFQRHARCQFKIISLSRHPISLHYKRVLFSTSTSSSIPKEISTITHNGQENQKSDNYQQQSQNSKSFDFAKTWKSIKSSLSFYKQASKQLIANRKQAQSIRQLVAEEGYVLTRRDNRLIRQSDSDMKSLIPFGILILLPGSALIMPPLIMAFPSLLPSTFESPEAKLKKRSLRAEKNQTVHIPHLINLLRRDFLSASTSTSLFTKSDLKAEDVLKIFPSNDPPEPDVQDAMQRIAYAFASAQSQKNNYKFANGIFASDTVLSISQFLVPSLILKYFPWTHLAKRNVLDWAIRIREDDELIMKDLKIHNIRLTEEEEQDALAERGIFLSNRESPDASAGREMVSALHKWLNFTANSQKRPLPLPLLVSLPVVLGRKPVTPTKDLDNVISNDD